MATTLTPRLLRRGLEIFVLVSLAGFVATFVYGNSLPAFFRSITQLRWGWVLVGVCLAAMDWIGGGIRLWVVAREIHPNPPLKGMILAGGMSAWAAYLTPFNSGAGPMMMYVMKRHGVPLPVAVTSTLMTFIATVAFFAIAGPIAILAGAGQALMSKGDVLGLSLYDLFLGSLGIFAALGVLFLALMIAPRYVHRGMAALIRAVGRRSTRIAARLEKVLAGLDMALDSLRRFQSPRGLLALVWATILSGPSHANKLLAGYVTLRALGIQANFVDVLLVQTLITFLLYFAPTPGASGIAEVLSGLIMTAYVPKTLTPLYVLIWRCILSYFTLAFGFFIFSGWVRRGLRQIAGETDESHPPSTPDNAVVVTPGTP